MRKFTPQRQGHGQSRGYRPITFFSYGPFRGGKTQFGATFPRPVFLSPRSEKGWETIENMDPALFYEPTVTPEVWEIENRQDAAQAVADLKAAAKAMPGRYLSVMLDSATYYADMYFSALRMGSGPTPDTRALYGDLYQHMLWLMIELHGLGLNVGWMALDDPPDADRAVGGPLLVGASGKKLPGACDYVFYHECLPPKEGAKDPRHVYQVRTKAFYRGGRPYALGGRDGGALPDPMESLTYRDLVGYLGIGAAPAYVEPPPARMTSNAAPPAAPRPAPAAAPRPAAAPTARPAPAPRRP